MNSPTKRDIVGPISKACHIHAYSQNNCICQVHLNLEHKSCLGFSIKANCFGCLNWGINIFWSAFISISSFFIPRIGQHKNYPSKVVARALSHLTRLKIWFKHGRWRYHPFFTPSSTLLNCVWISPLGVHSQPQVPPAAGLTAPTRALGQSWHFYSSD